jgi:hypothetical protein
VSSPTTPITDPVRPSHGTAPSDDPEAVGFAAELARSERGEGIDISEAGPPDEVLDQMARADAINTRLRQEGYEISFALSPDGCRLEIELRDSSGNLLRTLSASEAADLAAGKPLD